MNENDNLPPRYKLKYFDNIKNRLLANRVRRRRVNSTDSSATTPAVREPSVRIKRKGE